MSIKLEHVTYLYGQGTVYEKYALKDINLEIKKGDFIGIAGHTGSGKSTLIQHLNGLEKATSGKITYDGQDIYAKDFDLDGLRMKVGLTFQYPEYQLFEATVFEDVCFGPKNQKLPKEEIERRAREALQLVGFPEDLYEKSPFQLSGGQKRRVAIAGVLAMQPDYLILDEPAAGLDPIGRTEILEQIKKLHEEKGIAVILVSHSMEELAKYVDRMIVMNQGEKVFDDTPKKVFSHYKELEKIGLSAPAITYVMEELKQRGFPVRTDFLTIEEAKEEILKVLSRKSKEGNNA